MIRTCCLAVHFKKRNLSTRAHVIDLMPTTTAPAVDANIITARY